MESLEVNISVRQMPTLLSTDVKVVYPDPAVAAKAALVQLSLLEQL